MQQQERGHSYGDGLNSFHLDHIKEQTSQMVLHLWWILQPFPFTATQNTVTLWLQYDFKTHSQRNSFVSSSVASMSKVLRERVKKNGRRISMAPLGTEFQL